MADGVIKSTAEINTGKTMVEVKGGLVSTLPGMTEGEKDFAKYQISKYLVDNDKPVFMLLMRKEEGYISVLRNWEEWNEDGFAREIFNFIEQEVATEEVGIKLIENNGDYVEVWIGDKFYALFSAEGFLVNL